MRPPYSFTARAAGNFTKPYGLISLTQMRENCGGKLYLLVEPALTFTAKGGECTTQDEKTLNVCTYLCRVTWGYRLLRLPDAVSIRSEEPQNDVACDRPLIWQPFAYYPCAILWPRKNWLLIAMIETVYPIRYSIQNFVNASASLLL